jgi:3-hydroxyisobutyrate dehydrogenase
MAKRVGFIGLGIMGGGMAGQLLTKGFELTVWNRSAAKAAGLVQRGARLASTPADLARDVEVIVLMIRDDDSVRQVVTGPQGALSTARPGTAFINMSTTTPVLALEMAQTLAARGCTLLDAPVTGSKAAAASGQIGILVGGSAADLEAQRDVLSAMGNVTHVGPLGSSATFKLANNSLAATLVTAIGEALALCESTGLPRQMLVETFAATAARVCGLKKDKISQRDWSTDFALELMCKDLKQILDTAQKNQVNLPLITAVRDIHERSKTQGNGEQDFCVVADRGA